MDIEKQFEWLKPDRILKLYDGEKNMPGMNRLLAVGVGKNGVDCLMRVKDIAENRFNARNDRIRYFAAGWASDMEGRELHGSRLCEDEYVAIVPESSVYPYLDDPELLPEHCHKWFDGALKNYGQNPPKYGCQKRQGGRIALFHYIDEITKKLGRVINDFSKSNSPLEIMVTGNLGDPLFGGTVIDWGYILRGLFSTSDYPVKVKALLFAGDTAALFESDARDLANYYANTLISKHELDKFQVRKQHFSQKYSENLEICSEKPPYSSCFIASADESYEKTLGKAAEKILSCAEFIYKTDDDADRVMSYDILSGSTNHSFKYLAYDIRGVEIPIGKLVSYVCAKLFCKLSDSLKNNSAGKMQLGIYVSKVIPDANFLASRAGIPPRFEFDERLNPLFSMSSLKKGGEASKKYVTERVDEYASLVEKGSESVLEEASAAIEAACLDAASDISKGPFYAMEIMQKCLTELSNEIRKTNEDKEDIDEHIVRVEKLLMSDYKKLRSTPVFLANDKYRYYIQTLSEYAETLKKYKTLGTMLDFYSNLSARLTQFRNGKLSQCTEIFTLGMEVFIKLFETEPREGGMKEAFDAQTPRVREMLDKIVDDIPETTRNLAFKKVKLAADGDEKTIPCEIVNLAARCFGGFLLRGFNDYCDFSGENISLTSALRDCFEELNITTPADGETLTRAICPQNVSQGDIAPIKASHSGANYIWNGSPMSSTVIVTQTKSGVNIKEFKDYNQWENMRYAYANDALKKQGTRIFIEGKIS